MAEFPDWPGFPGREKLPAVHLYASGGANPPYMGTLGVWPTSPIELAVLDIAFDYADVTAKPRWYLQEGEFLTVSNWVVPPEIMVGDGVTAVGGSIPPAPSIIGGEITQAFFYADASAEEGVIYTVLNTFETSLDRADGRSFTLSVGPK